MTEFIKIASANVWVETDGQIKVKHQTRAHATEFTPQQAPIYIDHNLHIQYSGLLWVHYSNQSDVSEFPPEILQVHQHVGKDFSCIYFRPDLADIITASALCHTAMCRVSYVSCLRFHFICAIMLLVGGTPPYVEKINILIVWSLLTNGVFSLCVSDWRTQQCAGRCSLSGVGGHTCSESHSLIQQPCHITHYTHTGSIHV